MEWLDEAAGPEAFDRLRRRVLWMMPSGLYLIGSRSGSRMNLMTANWVSQLALQPKLVGVSLEVDSLTHSLVSEGGAFGITLLSRTDRALVRRFAKPVPPDQVSGDATGGGLEIAGVRARLAPSGVPVVESGLAWLDCTVTNSLGLGSHTLFVGEVTALGCGEPQEGEVHEGDGSRPESGPAALVETGAAGEPLVAEGGVLRMEDTRMHYGG